MGIQGGKHITKKEQYGSDSDILNQNYLDFFIKREKKNHTLGIENLPFMIEGHWVFL